MPLTIPNLITILRFVLVPAVVLAMLNMRWDWAFAGFLVAGISDGVDGFIARRFNQHSRLGAYLDPMADKVLLVSVFVVMGFIGQLPLWLVVTMVSRDALIICAVLLSTIMAHPVEMKPLYVSKANTAAQIVLAPCAGRTCPWPPPRPAQACAHIAVRGLDRGFGRGLSRGLAEAYERLWRRLHPG